jgi:molybdopterin synthase sulfur carrier subunit
MARLMAYLAAMRELPPGDLAMNSPAVTIELYGLPRLRAGRPEVVVAGATPAEALRHLSVLCPGLSDLCRPDGSLAPHYLLAKGDNFLPDLSSPLSPGDRLVLLSADAGG